MSDTTNFAKYSDSLRKCNKIFNLVPVFYILSSVLFFIVSFLFLITVNYSSLFTFIDGLIYAPAICYLGFRGAYHKHDLAAIAVPLLSLINLGVLKFGAKHLMTWKAYGSVSMNVPQFCFYICFVIFIVSSFIAYINIKANNQYRFLERQVGFPYFNERTEEQRVEKIRRDIKDPYQREYERLMRTSASEMTGIEFPESISK